MPKPNPETRVSTYFNLGRDQTTLDFVDVPIGNDTAVYLDPSRLRSMQSTWASECCSLLQHFFEALLRHLRNGSKSAGLSMLSALVERNEFHLGLSSGLSDGRAFGPEYVERIWSALEHSKASKSGLLKDLEDTCLFIEGVGPDRISDAVCNIIRGPLIRYTQDICNYYGIPLAERVDSGPVWNPHSEQWEDELVPLPVTPYGKLLLIPKICVRHQLVYDYSAYYSHYLLPAMQETEKRLNSGLVLTLRDGRQKVTKKSLKEKYGVTKLTIVEQTIKHPDAIQQYRDSAVRSSRPITHTQLSEVEKISPPHINKLLREVLSIKPGRDFASAYEDAIEKLLSAIFFPSLSSPTKQHRIHDGRKRVDITYVNNAQDGFFNWLSRHYACPHIFVECKNYGKEIGNPELDQLSGRFSPSRGQVGLLICRSVEDQKKIERSCIDTAKDSRGYIVVLADNDLEEIAGEYSDSNFGSNYPLLMSRFRTLLM